MIEVFIDELDLAALGFAGMTPAATGRPAYRPSTLLKIYLYGYIELMWLTGRLSPDPQNSPAETGASAHGENRTGRDSTRHRNY